MATQTKTRKANPIETAKAKARKAADKARALVKAEETRKADAKAKAASLEAFAAEHVKPALELATRAAGASVLYATEVIDACLTAGVEKTKEGCAFVARIFADNETLSKALKSDDPDVARAARTLRQYKVQVQKAFYWGVPFAPRELQKPDYALPWAATGESKPGKKAARPSKASAVNMATFKGQLKALIQTARSLGLSETASELLDIALEKFPDFKEA